LTFFVFIHIIAKMQKDYYKLISIGTIVLGLSAAVFIQPSFFNKGVDFLNAKLNWELPHMPEKQFMLGLDLQGGVELLYQADLSEIDQGAQSQAMEGLRDVISRRINTLGVREPEVETVLAGDSYRLKVRIPGITDPQEAIREIGRTPYLEFRELKDNYEEIDKHNKEVEEEGEGETEDVFKATQLTGRYLQGAGIAFDQTTYRPYITLKFNDQGAALFEEITGRNIGKPLAIFIDGQLLSAPRVQQKITGGTAQITGDFTTEEAQYLARNLNAGALPVPIGEPISQVTVGPTLGLISLQQSLVAGFYGILAIIIFLILIYRMPGLLAAIALLIYGVLVLALFKLGSFTLTLSGIGGFILSLGMAVDANVLIFSRMREEIRADKSIEEALEEGFKRAWPSIRDGNLTTLIVGLILFGVGTSFVQGFATTLCLGILISMFSAVFVTRSFLGFLAKTRLAKFKNLWL